MDRNIRKLLGQVYTDYIKGIALLALLDALIAFFIVRIITYITSIRKILPDLLGVPADLWVALVIGLIVFAWRASKKAAAYSVNDIETRIPALGEMLTTLKDTLTMNNPAVEEFRKDVLKTAKHANTARLIPLRKITIRMGVVFLLMILFGFLPLMAHFLDFVPNELPLPDDLLYLRQYQGPIDTVEIKDDESIYGEATPMTPGTHDLELTVDMGIGGGDLTNPMAWQNDAPRDPLAYRGAVGAVIDDPAVEELPVEYELAKAYNLKIKQIG